MGEIDKELNDRGLSHKRERKEINWIKIDKRIMFTDNVDMQYFPYIFN